MTNLTEQWKKGELPEETKCYIRVNGGIYMGSIRYKNGCHNKKLLYVKSFNGQFITKHVEEVIAPVPSYDEWKKFIDANTSLFDSVKMLEKDNFRLEKQNAELKDLLKECKSYVNHRFMKTRELLTKPYMASDKVLHKKAEKLLIKIDEVLK